MKKTDLEKNKALKLASQLKQSPTPDRFSTGSELPDRRERRKLDQAQGLVSFPVKLPQALADQVRARAVAQETGVNEVVARLIESALKAETQP